MIEDRAAFIRANTRILHPPHCGEIRLHLADDAVALWELTEEELGEMGLPPPFWAFAWAGGQALARYVLDHRESVAGKRVLDVASGSGIVAIAAMMAGAAGAVAADIDAFAADAAALNAALNGVAIETALTDPLAAPAAADIILVGDLFYDRDIAAALLGWLQAAARAGADVLVGDPGRSYFPKDAFVCVNEYEVPVTRALEDSEVKRTGVWRLAK
jgi:predicted nicotinamide N-methyase